MKVLPAVAVDLELHEESYIILSRPATRTGSSLQMLHVCTSEIEENFRKDFIDIAVALSFEIVLAQN